MVFPSIDRTFDSADTSGSYFAPAGTNQVQPIFVGKGKIMEFGGVHRKFEFSDDGDKWHPAKMGEMWPTPEGGLIFLRMKARGRGKLRLYVWDRDMAHIRAMTRIPTELDIDDQTTNVIESFTAGNYTDIQLAENCVYAECIADPDNGVNAFIYGTEADAIAANEEYVELAPGAMLRIYNEAYLRLITAGAGDDELRVIQYLRNVST